MKRKNQEEDSDDEDDNDAEKQVDLTLHKNETMTIAKVYDNWKDDPGERARRIYLWWVSHIKMDQRPIFQLSTALRLVALAHPASSAIERVFSQLQFLRHIRSDRLLSDLVNLCLMIRVNDGLVDDFTS